LAKTLDVKEDVAYTCETAEYFFVSHVQPKWEEFKNASKKNKTAEFVQKQFPFLKFFSRVESLFKGKVILEVSLQNKVHLSKKIGNPPRLV
jgi:intron-binding protein aquarius